MTIKKYCLLLLLGFFSVTLSHAQDRIIKKDGKELKCKRASVDSLSIYFEYYYKGAPRSTSIYLADITSYTINGKTTYNQQLASISRNLSAKQKYITSTLKLYADSVENKHNYFIVNQSNEIIVGSNIDYVKPFFGSAYIQIDSKQIQPYSVKFYKNEEGFYANTQNISATGISDFSQRVKKGKINLYETVKTNRSSMYLNSASPTFGPGAYGSRGTISGGISTTIIKNYYNIGFGPLKKADYTNLSLDLASNPESMLHLEKYKSVKNTQTILFVVGGVTLIGGIATLINKTKDWDGTDATPEPNVTANIISIGIGTGCFWASYFISFSKPKHLRNAIMTYNRLGLPSVP